MEGMEADLMTSGSTVEILKKEGQKKHRSKTRDQHSHKLPMKKTDILVFYLFDTGPHC